MSEKKGNLAKFSGTPEIQFHDGPLLLPDSMTPMKAYRMLGKLIKQQEEETSFNITFECLPQDGAAALNRTLISLYGWSTGIPTPGFFGPSPPSMMTIDTGPDTSIEVPWGRLALPNLEDGFVETGLTHKNGVVCFQLSARCKRKFEDFIKTKLFNGVAKELKDNSILRGKCFSIEFTDSSGDEMPIPSIKFNDTSKYSFDKLVLPEEIQRSLEISIWAPMRHHKKYRKEFGNLKRSILAAGGYGTGKTLSMSCTAMLAEQLGFTVIYCKKTKEFAKALRVARNYQAPCSVLIIEDIDVELAAGRSDDLNQIINTLDGLDTKKDNIITLMTTNDIEALEPAAIRQGRVSAKVMFTNPDAKAVEKLLRLNCADLISEDEDLTEVGNMLNGMNPAEIEEAVTISKTAHMHLTGEMPTHITSEDLVEAAKYMQTQAKIQRDIEELHENPPEITVDSIINEIVQSKTRSDKDLSKLVTEAVREA